MAEAAADFAVSTVLETLLGPIKRHIGYAFEFRSKVDALSDETRNLKLERESLLESIEVAQGRGELVKPRFIGWRTEADTAIADAEEVVRKGEETAQKRCSLCLNLKARYQLGKKADQGKQGVVRLRAEKVSLGTDISYLPAPQQIVKRPLEGYEAQSRNRILKEVMDAISDPNITMVGLYGMGGIGKTTLAEEIYHQATTKSLFYKVVIAKVTAMPEIRAIQDKIADFFIGSELKGITDDARASGLNQRLNEILKDKKILIILDDIWSVLDLDKVGIPTDNKSCKILMTSRGRDLLSTMGSTKNFPLQVLSKEESMSLFEKKVTVVKYREIAEEILGICAGFPLLIITIAGLLKNKNEDLDAWKNVSTELKQLDNQEVKDKVYPILELSYDRLSGTETKLIFLLCGICSWSSFKLTDLLWYSFGLGLLQKYTTISSARRHLKSLIGKLKDCSLLDIDEHGDIRMHDVVREVAISIARKEGLAYRNSNELAQWPSGNEINNCTKVSMIGINVENLPENLECPDVEFLLLFKRGLINIPDSAFEGTRQLKVIHFREVKFVSMPRSLYSLKNLHTLHLEYCKFPNLDAAIGKLENLEILSFCESDLEALPSEVGQLTRLKLLDLRMCHKLEFIPANVISKLTSLEELLMRDGFKNWEIEGHSSGSNARLSELKCLSHLASLEIFVPDVRALPGSFFSMCLERYEIRIGKGFRMDLDLGRTKSMSVDLSASIDLLEKARNLLMEAEVVCLSGINGVTNLLDIEAFSKKWKELLIVESPTLQQIVDYQTAVSFRELKTLCISNCCKLKSLFSVSAIRSLPQLEKIIIKNCNEMEALFVVDEESTQVVEFCYLRNLELRYLPKLKCFLDVITSKSSKTASTTTKLSSLFNEKVALPSLKRLELCSIDNIEMVWSSGASGASGHLNSLTILYCHKLQTVSPDSTQHSFHKLESLAIFGCGSLKILFPLVIAKTFSELKNLSVAECDKLKSLFSVSAVRSLPQLEEIKITGCNEMEALFVIDEESTQVVEFGCLRNLDLKCLPKLKCFLDVITSNSSKTGATTTKLVSLFNEKVALPSLEKLELRSIDNIELIWSSGASGQLNSLIIWECDKLQRVFSDSTQHSFHKLESQHIVGCRSLKILFPVVIAKTFSELKNLEVAFCDKLEEIVEAGEESTNRLPFRFFPQLTSLTLLNLRELRSLYPFGHTSKWPNLGQLKVLGCPKTIGIGLFGEQGSLTGVGQSHITNQEKAFPNLEKMSIKGGKFHKTNLNSRSWWSHVPALKTLELRSFRGRSMLELSEVGALRELVVYDSHIKQLWEYNKRSSGLDGPPISCPPSIRSLYLFRVAGLRHVGRGDSKTEDPLLPFLESMELHRCSDLISLAPLPSSASFRNLSNLELVNCDKMTGLINPSTAKTMVNLVCLEIRSCRAMEEIVAAEEDDDQSPTECIIVFNKLKTLVLAYLPSFKGFCTSGCYSFNLPCLEDVTIRECSSMRIFCNGAAIMPKLQKMDIDNTKYCPPLDINTTIKQFFKDGFPDELQHISWVRLSKFPHLVERWGTKYLPPFKCLYKLVVDMCAPLLPIAVPSNVVPSLRKLRKLVVEKCESVEEIFDLDGMDQENEPRIGIMSGLQKLKLTELPKLRHVWNEDPLGILGGFQNLSVLKVYNCGNLTHIFTFSVALGLVSLKRLQVKGCGLVEVIIDQQGEDEKPTADRDDPCISIFPSLDSVELEDLPSLQEFCSGVDHVLICPHLTRITAVGCPGVRILGRPSTGSSSTERHPANGIPHDQTPNKPALHIFNDQIKISGLLKLDVQWNSSMDDKAWHELIPRSFLHGLEYVKLTGFPADHELLPLDFVEAMPNLEKFFISDSFYKQILPRFVCDAGFLEKLTYLELFNLPELYNLIEEEGSQSVSVFQHLEVLEVSKCKRLTRLMTSKTARGLVNLKKIVVKDCKEMTEILSSNGGGEEGDEIAFDRLMSLELKGLSCLTNFSSGNDTFTFPLLEDMIIIECPDMKTFSKNDPGTPNLSAVQIAEIEDEDPWSWEGGLNNTIEKLYTERNPIEFNY